MTDRAPGATDRPRAAQDTPTMRTALLLILTLLGCSRASALFESRKDLPPLRARLLAAGGDPARVIDVRALADLTRLDSGARYKFSLPADGRMRVAPLPIRAPNNEYVHPVLVDGAPVRTAGSITVKHDGNTVTGAMVDRDSRAYCPSEASVGAAIDALRALGLPRGRISVEPSAPQCDAPRG